MKVYEFNGEMLEGAAVSFQTLSNGVKIPVIEIGQQGRGRSLAVVPVVGLSGATRLETCNFENGRLISGGNSVGVVVVFKTPIGFRGSNSHSGDYLRDEKKFEYGEEVEVPVFDKFPGEVIARGKIAQGTAGYMGSGEQLIAIFQDGDRFVIHRTGRTYGNWREKYFSVQEGKIQPALSPAEKKLL